MKKGHLIITAIALTATLTGFGGTMLQSQSIKEIEHEIQELTNLSNTGLATILDTPQNTQDEEERQSGDPIYVADAALYRGTIVSLETSERGTIATLEQETGTDFGAKSMRFLFTEDSKTSFARKDLTVGKYLEVYYGRALGEEIKSGTEKIALGANLYPEANMVLFNGIVEKVTPSKEKKGEGSILVKDMANDQEVIFHYSEENTRFYMNMEDFKAGTKLSILHRGMMTRSLPPQGSALEIRKFAEQPKISTLPAQIDQI